MAGEGVSPRIPASSSPVSAERQRGERELFQAPVAAQLVAQMSQRVVARQAVGPVAGDDEDAQLAERLGERGEQLERRVVGPVQVVEQQQHGLLAREVGERAPHGFGHRRRVAGRRRVAELGEQQREVRAQRAEAVERGRVGPQARPQRGHHRRVRRRRAAAGAAREHECSRTGGQRGGEPRLSHSRLTGQQHERARAMIGAFQRLLEAREL